MNIIYKGMFLEEGLRQLGHEVTHLPLPAPFSLAEALSSTPSPPDMVILEIWGGISALPQDLADCPCPLVAYCIDSSLNTYWLSDFCQTFDYIFVDQLVSVQALRKKGLRAHWLPLCAQEYYFRPPQEHKQYDITFVGRTTTYRPKRTNLLAMLQKHFPVNVVQDVSMPKMIDLFSQSKIVLNENLFNGLTLRTFQGLASGSILLTEAASSGTEHFFNHNEHLINYTPETILPLCNNILNNSDAYKHIGTQGQALCREKHTSKNRAADLLAMVGEEQGYNKRREKSFLTLSDAKGRYRYTQRFGGSLQEIRHSFQSMAQPRHPMAVQAFIELGDMEARKGKTQEALLAYTSSVGQSPTLEALLKLAFLMARHSNTQGAQAVLAQALPLMSKAYLKKHSFLFSLLESCADEYDLFLVIAHAYFSTGRICDVGFQKSWPDNTPETALTLAFLIWDKKPRPDILDFIILCAKEADVEGELLPLLTQAWEQGLLSKAHTLYAAECALQYYDTHLASRMLSSITNKPLPQ